MAAVDHVVAQSITLLSFDAEKQARSAAGEFDELFAVYSEELAASAKIKKGSKDIKGNSSAGNSQKAKADAMEWLHPKSRKHLHPRDSEYKAFGLRAACDNSMLGFICASVCVNGKHDRHYHLHPVDWTRSTPGATRKRRCTGQLLGSVAVEVYVFDIYVSPASRGSGLGTQLVDKVFQYGREQSPDMGFVRVSGDVLTGNKGGMSFWTKYFDNGMIEDVPKISDEKFTRLSKDYECL